MFISDSIDNVMVFCPQKLKREKENFLKLLKSSTEEFSLKINNLSVVEIKKDFDEREWTQACRNNLNPKINLAIFIITGPKVGSKIYKSLKNLLYEQFPVPSQMINAKTLSNPRNQRSIVNKILI